MKPRRFDGLLRAFLAVFIAFAVQLVSTVPAVAFSPRALLRPVGAVGADYFGYSVSTAGDVNGDGYDDVIVGAYGNDTGGSSTGQAYVYYGGPNADAVADLTLTGEAAGDYFGYSVSAAGDVNGDGYADVIVGALNNDAAGSNAGRAYVFYGGSVADTIADVTLTGEATNDTFGISVSTAGDVNGDGYADVIVGARANNAGGSLAGRAYVYHGGPGVDAVADLTLTGAAAADFFGVSVSTAGDVNGDGYADVIVGAYGSDAGGSDAGRAYVYYGGPGADTVADLTFTGDASLDYFGASVSGAGDVNGDGYADVIVGAYRNDNAGTNAGEAYVYYGGHGADAIADLTLTGGAGDDNLGVSVSTAGDVNGDGYADVIVGAYTNDAGGTNAGQAYVYYGGAGPDSVADLTFTGEAATDNFGISVSAAGDVDGDGYADVIVGAHANDTAGTNAGRAYVYTSRPYDVLAPDGGEQWVAGSKERIRWLGADLADLWISLDGGATYSLLVSRVGGASDNEFILTAPGPATYLGKIRVSASEDGVSHASSDVSEGVFSIVEPHDPPLAAARLQLSPMGEAAQNWFGLSVSTAGDVNGDDYADVIVGAHLNSAGGTDAGRAYVYHCGPGADAVADLTLTGEAPGNTFGTSVGTAGDANGDGYADVIVGAHQNDAGGTDAGRAYVYYGGPSADAVADLTFTGEAAWDFFGLSVSGAGDVNGDDYADVIVGAPGNDAGGTDAGRAYIYYGGPNADVVADLTLTGKAVDHSFGSSVSGAGDVNGDGYADAIVGAYGDDTAGANAGRAYVYYGGPGADAVADLTFTGEAAWDLFGLSVSGAGDVNGDGYADLIVGADENDAGGASAGRAYVYYGGPGADAMADLTLTGEAPGDYFGSSVSGAGDVNGDGYSDVIVGAYGNDAGGNGKGRAYIYYGGAGADETADVILTGAVAGDQLGMSVSGAGDVSGDGYADVIVGAPVNDAGGENAGRAYVYDLNRYHLLSPIGGETWNVGATKTISWLGAELADVWLSVDGGMSYEMVKLQVGGAASNLVPLQVPHVPSKFAKIRVTPSDATAGGGDESDSLFTIQTSVALLALLAAPVPDRVGVAEITWSTSPGSEDLAGYRLARASGSAGDWRTLVSLTRETSYTDETAGVGGARYRLYAVNGLGEELMLGETSLRPLRPLSVWPLPYRGGNLTVSFATGSGLGGATAPAEVALYDVHGRLVRRIAQGHYRAGYQSAVWDGLDDRGRKVAAGVYFLRSESAGQQRALKLAVVR